MSTNVGSVPTITIGTAEPTSMNEGDLVSQIIEESSNQ